MQVDLKKIKPLGIILILGFSVLVFVMCLTVKLGVPEKYTPAHYAAYYASSAETLAELAEEAKANVLTAFGGDIHCEPVPEEGLVRVVVDRGLKDRVAAVLERDFGPGLFSVTERQK